jgi:outer membrane receptor protein involved in Fe transport
MRHFAGRLALRLGVTVVLASLPVLAFAQTESGKITGSVTDQSGGVLPGASVTLKNVNTNATRSAVSDAGGNFTFSNLLPGPFELTVELAGFTTKQYKTTVSVGATVRVDARLEVGQQTEVVTVVAGAEGVQPNVETQDIASTITERQIRELPTVTRNPYDLVAIAGNVVRDISISDAATSQRGTGFAINGQRSASTNILLDGAANNDEFVAGIGQQVPLDTVQEFSVITSNFSAEYGRASGGVVNVATKSGTNDFHGNLYEFYRGDGLTANTYENNANEIPKGEFNRHQMGFTLGGPIQRDKVHFFMGGEYIRVRSSDSLLTWVPTPELIAASAPATRNYFANYDTIGSPSRTVSREEVTAIFGGSPTSPFNSLPAGMPVFGLIEQSVPADAGGGVPQNTYQGVGRLDFNISSNTTAYVRYAYERVTWEDATNSQSPWQGFQSTFFARNHNALASVTHIWSPSFTTQTKVVYNRLAQEQPLGDAPPTPGLYMNPATPVRIQGLRIGFPGYLPFNPGSAIPFGGPQQLYQFYQDMNWIKGKHDIRIGGSYVRIKDDRTFGAYQNAVQALNTASAAAPSLDNFVLGRINRFQVAINPNGFPGGTYVTPVGFPNFTDNNRYNEFAIYFNDAWSVSPRFKLNLGVRYEYFGVQQDVGDPETSNFYYRDVGASVNTSGADIFNQVAGGQVFRASESPIGSLWAPDKNNFAPRVGFVWDVNGDGKTSIRGGYGIGYERNFGNVTFNALFNPPNFLVSSIDVPTDLPSLSIQTDNQGPFGGVAGVRKTIPRGSLRHIDQNVETAYAHFYSLSLQRQLEQNTLISLEYTGSTGRKLYDLADVNLAGAAFLYLQNTTNPFGRPNLQYTAFNTRGNRGRSQYHGVTVGIDARKIANTGLSMTAKYTLSRAKDNLSTTFSEGSNTFNLGYLDPLDPDLDYGYASFDARHRFSSSGIWELPVARDSQFWGGWQLAWLFTAQSGQPFTVYDCTNGLTRCMRALDPGGLSTDATQGTDTGSPNQFNLLDLTPAAPLAGSYAHPTQGTSDFGPWPSNMTARNAFRGPGRYFLDMMLSKRFRFGDRYSLQLRAEAYNILNHSNLYVLGETADVSSATFVSGARGQAVEDVRRIQLAAKFEF